LMPKRYQKFSPEFREEAAKMVVDGSRAVAGVARELGVGETTLGNWGVPRTREVACWW
jgi:transposase-like protein